MSRWSVGDRVTCARGFCIGSTGRIAKRAPARDASGRPQAKWVVRFDAPVTLGSGTVLQDAWFDDSEIEPWTVPAEARPVSVGALAHPMRGSR